MNIPVTSIVGFIGLVALGLGVLLILAGLDIFKFQQVTISGGKRTWMVGAVLVVIGILLLLPEINRSTPNSSTDSASTSTPTLIPALSESPTITPSSTPEPGIPVITALKMREDTSSGNLIIYQDLYFYDSDGDTNFIQWKVLSSTITDINVTNGPVTASPAEQQAGTFTTGTWGCNGGAYSIKFQATLLDSAGHESNPFEYTIECK